MRSSSHNKRQTTALLLRENDVTLLLDMPTAIAAVEEVLRHQARGAASIRPRQRLATPNSQLHVMAGSDQTLGVYGLKAYTSSRTGARFLVLLYEAEAGDLLAMIEADKLGQMRTGAASAVATRFMAREDAHTIGIIGTGWQAESQITAICAVQPINSIKVYSRHSEHREAFAQKMTAALGLPVTPVETAEKAIRDQEIIITATTAREPVLDGRWIAPGTHINAIGANFLSKREAGSGNG